MNKIRELKIDSTLWVNIYTLILVVRYQRVK